MKNEAEIRALLDRLTDNRSSALANWRYGGRPDTPYNAAISALLWVLDEEPDSEADAQGSWAAQRDERLGSMYLYKLQAKLAAAEKVIEAAREYFDPEDDEDLTSDRTWLALRQALAEYDEAPDPGAV